MERLVKLVNKIVTKGLEPFGIYYSTYTGIVIDNNDPDNLNRLKIAVPGVYGETIFPDWVQPRSVFSGVNYGMQVLPPKGSVIQVTFTFGSPKYPRWEHGFFGKTADKTSEISDPELQKKNNYWFKTPGGLLVSLDDDKKTVNIIHTSGISFRVGENSIDLKVDGGYINLGKFDEADEPAVLGDKLESRLSEILTHCSQITVNVAGIISSPPVNAAEFIKLKGGLVNIKSKVVKLD